MRSEYRYRVEFGQPSIVFDDAGGWTKGISWSPSIWASVSINVRQDEEANSERSIYEITAICRWFSPMPNAAWVIRFDSQIYQVETIEENGIGRDRTMTVTATRRGYTMGNYDYTNLMKNASLIISAGGTDTAALDREIYQNSGQIGIPATWTAANLLVLTSIDGVSYQPLLDGSGCYVTIDCEPSYNSMLPAELKNAGARYIKLRSVTKTDAAVSVAQTVDAILPIVLTK